MTTAGGHAVAQGGRHDVLGQRVHAVAHGSPDMADHTGAKAS